MKQESALEVENARLRGDLLTMASRIGHDLRTPLGGIVGAAEVLREILAERKMPITLTQAIFDSVDDMTRLIRQVSFVARATANPLSKEPVRMEEIVAAALERLESRILKKNATIVEPPSWPQVKAVAPWLEMVWWNFLANALQHTGGRPRVELSWQIQTGGCRFGVCDDGGGVPDQIRPGLFRSFDSLHHPEGAHGLGLSIVQRLVELQGGACGYEPRPGGSCFFFTLPDV